MVYNEIASIVTREILKCYWRKGGLWKKVHFGHPDFKPDFWPDSWPWECVHKNLKNLRKEDYAGPGNLTEFLRTALRNRLDSLEINPSKYVSHKCSTRTRKNRMKYRGLIDADIQDNGPIANLEVSDEDSIEVLQHKKPRLQEDVVNSLEDSCFMNETDAEASGSEDDLNCDEGTMTGDKSNQVRRKVTKKCEVRMARMDPEQLQKATGVSSSSAAVTPINKSPVSGLTANVCRLLAMQIRNDYITRENASRGDVEERGEEVKEEC